MLKSSELRNILLKVFLSFYIEGRLAGISRLLIVNTN